MAYVNGFLAPVARDQLDAYRKTAAVFAEAVMANGALACAESSAGDLEWGRQTSFPRAVELREGEVVVFSFIVFPSKEASDRGMEAVMADPDLQAAINATAFDGKRMIWSGFESMVVHGVGGA